MIVLIVVTGILNHTLKSGYILVTDDAGAIFDCDMEYLLYFTSQEPYVSFSNCLDH